MYNILIIDDNPEILEANSSYFSEQGFCVSSSDNGIKAIVLLNKQQFDCIVLDVLLPDLDGFTLCRAIRTITNTPIIFLTCMDDLDDKIKGLAVGGDDYLTKPYSLKELAGRVKALIRRNHLRIVQSSDDFYIDHANRMIHTNEKNVFLSQKEYDLFMLFYENPGTVFSKKEIFDRIWQGAVPDYNVVTVYVLKLRRKLSFASKYSGRIETRYKSGYLFIPGEAGGEKGL